MAATFTRWFEELGRGDLPLAGGKGANLGEMTRAGLPVPPGFVVTAEASRRVFQQPRVAAAIQERLRRLNVNDPASLEAEAAALQQIVESAELPEEVRQDIVQAYRELARRETNGQIFVAVRSSATVEDTPRFSFAGMFRSFLNVRGEAALLRAYQQCLASTFGARVLFYRATQGVAGEPLLAVIVQKMVDADKSGVLFTVDPATRNRRVLVIEAAWGLGEVVVGGQVTPDRYVVDKATLRLLERVIGRKDFKLVRDPATGENVRVDLPESEATAAVLSDREVQILAELGRRDEAHYNAPQDAEWAIEGENVYLVQTRPVTTLGVAAAPGPERARAEVLVRGLGASPGVATGPVRVLYAPDEGGRLQQGDILVTTMTSPDWVPVMRRAAAIVTDGGGMTSHAAIVSRELGIPCVVGTQRATRVLQEGWEITVDGAEGVVYRGRVAEPARAPAPGAAAPPAVAAPTTPVTATRLYVNLGEPERAEEIARLPVDGVGLLRAEFMLLSALEGQHPRLLLERGKGDHFVERMAESLRVFARAFSPRPVIYRSMDFRTNEFRGLEGGERFEPAEANPMIGYRGCYRYVREPDLFTLELRALARVRQQFSNLHLMIPFVRTAWEFEACKRIIDATELAGQRDFELWVMAEVPSVVSWLPRYAAAGATGVSIGSNDLTQLVLGVDRDSEVLASLFDERDAAVLETIRAIIKTAHRLGLSASICGQAPSVFPDYAETLVRWGIDSISVNPDVIDVTRRHIAAAEQRILLEGIRNGDGATPITRRPDAETARETD